MLNHISK